MKSMWRISVTKHGGAAWHQAKTWRRRKYVKKKKPKATNYIGVIKTTAASKRKKKLMLVTNKYQRNEHPSGNKHK